MSLTGEEKEELLYFMRFCWILQEDVRKNLVSLFKKKVEENGDFKELYHSLPSYEKEMKNLAKFSTQEARFKDNIESWDITLLTSYLKECSLCELCHPSPAVMESHEKSGSKKAGGKKGAGKKAEANSEAPVVKEADGQKWKLSGQLLHYKDGCTGRVKYVHDEQENVENKYKNFVKAVKLISKEEKSITLKSGIPSPGDAKLSLSVVTPEWHIIDAIRELRNTKYGHREVARMKKQEFENIFDEVMGKYDGMKWDKTEIQRIKDWNIFEVSVEEQMEVVDRYVKDLVFAVSEAQGNEMEQAKQQIAELKRFVDKDLRTKLMAFQAQLEEQKKEIAEVKKDTAEVKKDVETIKNITCHPKLWSSEKRNIFVFSSRYGEQKIIVDAFIEKLSGQSNSSKWITPSLSNWHDVLKHIKEAEFLVFFACDTSFLECDEVGNQVIQKASRNTYIVCNKTSEEIKGICDHAVGFEYKMESLLKLAKDIANPTTLHDGPEQEDGGGKKILTSQMIFEDLKCVSASWKNFGIMVGIDNKNIKKIQENSKKTDCFSEVIETWLGGNQENVTREKLAHAVRVAGNEGLACDILADRQFKLTLPYLLKKLRPMMSTYNILGNQLELKSSDIRNWEVVRIDVDYCMNEVVMKWFENKESKPSMEVLKGALEFINEFGLYQDLKKKYEGYCFSE